MKKIETAGALAAAQMIGYTAMAYLNGDNINPTKYEQYQTPKDVQKELIESAEAKRVRKEIKRAANNLKSIGGSSY